MRFFHQGHSKWPQTFEQYFQIEFVNICRFISFYLFHYSPVCSQRRLRLQKMSLFSLSLKWYLKVVLWWQKCWLNETNLEFFEIDHLVVRTKKNRLEWIVVCLDSSLFKALLFQFGFMFFICVLLLSIAVLYYFLYSVNKVIYSIFFLNYKFDNFNYVVRISLFSFIVACWQQLINVGPGSKNQINPDIQSSQACYVALQCFNILIKVLLNSVRFGWKLSEWEFCFSLQWRSFLPKPKKIFWKNGRIQHRWDET